MNCQVTNDLRSKQSVVKTLSICMMNLITCMIIDLFFLAWTGPDYTCAEMFWIAACFNKTQEDTHFFCDEAPYYLYQRAKNLYWSDGFPGVYDHNGSRVGYHQNSWRSQCVTKNRSHFKAWLKFFDQQWQSVMSAVKFPNWIQTFAFLKHWKPYEPQHLQTVLMFWAGIIWILQ